MDANLKHLSKDYRFLKKQNDESYSGGGW